MKYKKQIRSFLFVAITVLVVSNQSHAVDIQFPEADLAKESVYPVFDNPEAVKRRNVTLANRVELGIHGGWSLNDALVDPLAYGLSVAYHFSELHAFQLQAGGFSAKASQHIPGIEEKLPAGQDDLSNIPKPKYLFLGNYQISPYYGKISMTKQAVMNLIIFATAGAGTIAIGDSNYFAFSLGIGQKLYFGKNFGIRADLKALFHQAPNPLSPAVTSGDNPPNSYYETHSVTNGLLTVSLIYTL